jgi:RND superfamily putative drug exporter
MGEVGGQELIGLLVAVVVLLVAFGSFIAMSLPIGTALLGIAVTMGLSGLLANVIDINFSKRD